MPTPQRIHRQITKAGLEAIKRREGLRLNAYQDDAGVWTIGYGHTGDVWKGDVIDEGKAEDLLREDVKWAETTISASVQVPLKDHQFDALVSWAFNIGTGQTIDSTLVRRLNAGEFDAVPSELMRWVKVTSPTSGKKLFSQGLQNRRQSEVNQWMQANSNVQKSSSSKAVGRTKKSSSSEAVGQTKKSSSSEAVGQMGVGLAPSPIPAGRVDISKSRTLRGGAVAGAGTIAGSVLEAVENAKPQVAEAMWFMPTLKWVFVGLVLVGLAAVIYARLDDYRKGET